ncbi:GntR family transcriptional regulator [Jannaschia aquimarina]|uniref:CsiR protein n=1 Tax=Jannaschia aquimarina TaxID=935700 RepID=A0A0D1CKG9_9RHOB|nr:GntR family transcriptional regulator [Jannaschia aquimarina]KIT15242.1 HTH-type transcriptional repressor CsiR [Jannaschia aquimarina]SNT32400.1 transcriptional regulator, GntR family [Jannaschia aquimarina]
MTEDLRAAGRLDTPAIYNDLERKLVTGVFAAGTKLKPGELQSVYGCSANTVRDVLLQLSKGGLVEFEMQRGFRASPSTSARRRDVADFRIMLEQEGAVRSMERGGIDWESRLSAAHYRLSHIESQIARQGMAEHLIGLWSDAERNFHETLISECGSPLLIEAFTRTYLQFRQQINAQQPDLGAGDVGWIIEEHQAILAAAVGGVASDLRDAIRAHLDRHL